MNHLLRSIIAVAIVLALLVPEAISAAPAPTTLPASEPPKTVKGRKTIKLGKSGSASSAFKFEAVPEHAPAWPTGYALRFPLRVVNDPAALPGKSVMARLPAGCWLKKDGSDVAVQNAAGELLPMRVLSHDPNGDTIIQFARSGNDRWYWAYAGHAGAPLAVTALPPVFQEGLVAEYRQWAGDEIDTWANVVDGLKKSENVIGNAPLAEIVANSNPARPNDPTQFATSYRGYLNIKTAGAYRFLANAQDAAFLFIDGHKVFERGGQNERLTGRIPVSKNGALIDLAAGVHPFEVHHVVGNNPASFGYCVLLWVPPGATQWGYVPPEAFSQPLYATAADIESQDGGQVATFAAGVDDVLASVGQTLYLMRFEAQGTIEDSAKLQWDFGDGTTGTGASVTHVYFKEGPYVVKLKSGKLPPFQRTVVAWNAPVESSPFSLGNAVRSLAASDWQKLDLPRLKQAFAFLQVCEQLDRWPLMEAISRRMLALPDEDPQFRATAHVSLMEALARQGKGEQALVQSDAALAEFAKVPSLQVRMKLAAADVHFRHLRQVDAAGKAYRAILEEHQRLEIPEVRLAAIRLADLYAEAGDVAKAAEAYRLAGTLGGTEFEGTAGTDAITRGAMLRVAEQRLRAGDVRQTRALMEKIEVTYPEQKLEGLYRFLRAEADRAGGRYEDAIENYQFLLKLQQWAGYRAKAMFGIADSFSRAGDDAKAVQWLESLEESFPKFYDDQKLPDYRRAIDLRRSRARAAPATAPGAPGAAPAPPTMFAGFHTSFEPDDERMVDEVRGLSLVPGLGIGGTYIGLMEAIPISKGYADGVVRLRNIVSGGYLWVEVWQRESLNNLAANSHMHAWIFGAGNDTDAQKGQGTSYFNRTHGEWRKLGFLIRAPITQDGRVVFSIRQVNGAMEIDSLSITPVSDRQYDALLSFAQRQDAP